MYNKYMEDNFVELKEYIKKIENFTLPEYNEISSIPLYMEQVIGYIQEILSPLCKSEEDISSLITPFMVNNYVKAKIVDAPINKKYNKEHIGYLIAISLLKKSASMKDIATLIEFDKFLSDDKEKLYSTFKTMQDEIIKSEARKVKIRLEALEKSNKKKQDKMEENADLCYVALRLYIESEVAKYIADSVIEKVSKDVLPSSLFEDDKKVKHLENKKETKEAKKLSSRKK